MLDHKIVVTALLDGLTEDEFLHQVLKLIKAQQDNSAIVPALSPTASAEATKAATLKGYFDVRDSLKAQQKRNTKKINNMIKEIKKDVISNWCPQVQTAVEGDTDKVKLLGMAIKGKDDQKPEPNITVCNSKPSIENISLDNLLEHDIFIRNNKSGKIGLPFGAKRADIYISYGEAMPQDIRRMFYLGSPYKGKFTNTFSTEQTGMKVWYIVVYVPKNKKVVCQMSDPKMAIII
jgi:hypothetical protein